MQQQMLKKSCMQLFTLMIWPYCGISHSLNLGGSIEGVTWPEYKSAIETRFATVIGSDAMGAEQPLE